MSMEVNELSKNANGGTELMLRRLYSSIDPVLIDNFQIIPSRVRELNPDKYRILWLHDLPGDPGADDALKNGGWNRFHRIICVSNWQMQGYANMYNIPWSKFIVVQNAIQPIERELPWVTDGKIRFIYHTTPHRGLDILAAVFSKLCETHDDIHLDVYSSFELYGWKDRDAQFQGLFDQIKEHPNMTYHGSVSNDEIRTALQNSHIYAYPCTWLETSCLSLIEAMSAGLICIHPNYGALFETSANWTTQYQWNEDKNKHAATSYNIINNVLTGIKEHNAWEGISTQIRNQKAYADLFYNWNVRKHQWESIFLSLLNEPKEITPQNTGVYTYRG